MRLGNPGHSWVPPGSPGLGAPMHSRCVLGMRHAECLTTIRPASPGNGLAGQPVTQLLQRSFIAAHQVIRARGFELSALSALPIPPRAVLRHREESPRDRVAPPCSCRAGSVWSPRVAASTGASRVPEAAAPSAGVVLLLTYPAMAHVQLRQPDNLLKTHSSN